MVANQTEFSRLSSNFWWQKSANHVKFWEECLMSMKKYISVQKMFANRLEVHWLSSKEKILGTAVSKEGYADNLQKHERTRQYWFPWKRCNCKLLRIANSLSKIHLIYWMTLVCMYVCVYWWYLYYKANITELV